MVMAEFIAEMRNDVSAMSISSRRVQVLYFILSGGSPAAGEWS